MPAASADSEAADQQSAVKFHINSAHPRWRGGKTVTAKGYVRLTAGPLRHKYEHRAMAEEIWGGPLPPHLEVHHMDGKRAHNRVGCWRCGSPGNLLLIDKRLHSAIRVREWSDLARRSGRLP